jgi:HK97 family phage prohead protease
MTTATPRGFDPTQRQTRLASFTGGSYNAETRTAEIVISSGAPVRRWFGFEELAVADGAVDLARVGMGQVRLLDHHNGSSRDAVLGVLESARIEDGRLVGSVRFGETEQALEAAGQVERGELTGISAGYRILSWRMVSVDENDNETWRAERWELLEVSLVSIPADPHAGVRSADLAPTEPPASPVSPEPDAPAATRGQVMTQRSAEQDAPANTPAPVVANTQDTGEALRAERTRAAEIQTLAAQHNLPADITARAIQDGVSVADFRGRAFDALAARHAPTSHATVRQDETETRRLAMEEAITRTIGIEQGDWSEPARAFRGFSLVDLAAERLGERRVASSFSAREEVLRRAMHTTSDFPILLENAVNRSLAPSYALAQPTYREIAIREDFNDFRAHTTVTAGDFPMLQPINEAGEIKFGTVGEKKESVAVAAYAIGLSFSRQLMVNDNLNGLARVIANYGQSVALFEEKTAYAVKALNSGDGPSLLEGSAAMFTTARTNKAAANAAINKSSIGLGYAAMRKFKSIDGNELLFNAPSLILVGPDKEIEAREFLSLSINPATAADVSVFRGTMRPIVSQMISGNGWELYVDPSVRANFRWGLLSGYTAPRVRIENPFGVQGTQMSVEHDFGFGGIDWRAGYRNAGA